MAPVRSVQTLAVVFLALGLAWAQAVTGGMFGSVSDSSGSVIQQAEIKLYSVSTRSEERRVGKECRSRWSPYH